MYPGSAPDLMIDVVYEIIRCVVRPRGQETVQNVSTIAHWHSCKSASGRTLYSTLHNLMSDVGLAAVQVLESFSSAPPNQDGHLVAGARSEGEQRNNIDQDGISAGKLPSSREVYRLCSA